MAKYNSNNALDYNGLPTPLAVFINNLPAKPYATNDLENGLKILPKRFALNCDYIQFNPVNSYQWLVFDIDKNEDIFGLITSGLIPMPNMVALNQWQDDTIGSGHFYYLLSNPVHNNPTSSSSALKYLTYIQKCLTMRLGADPRYVGLIAKNPTSRRWYVWQPRLQPYDLAELGDWCSYALINGAKNIVIEQVESIRRNCTIFDSVRQWAYTNVKHTTTYESWLNTLLNEVNNANKQFIDPLPTSGVKSIAKSIAKYTYRFKNKPHTQAFLNKQKMRAAKGGAARSEKYQTKREHVLLLKEKGMNNGQIAEMLNVSRRTVINWLK